MCYNNKISAPYFFREERHAKNERGSQASNWESPPASHRLVEGRGVALSETKIWAGITPHSEQRGIVQLCRTLGGQVASMLSNVPMALMGLKEVLGLTDYQIMIYGALIFAPLTIFCRWLPSYAKQRVDFTVKVRGEDETEEAAADTAASERPPSFRENFAVVKHNRWFITWTIINFMRLFIPGTDEAFLYRFLMPQTGMLSKIKIGDIRQVVPHPPRADQVRDVRLRGVENRSAQRGHDRGGGRYGKQANQKQCRRRVRQRREGLDRLLGWEFPMVFRSR
jgi:hypothetical protein